MTDFWIIFICDLLAPIIIIIAGILTMRAPAGEVNRLYGYRTERSMRSKEAWKFAQAYSGRLLTVSGIVALVVTALLHLPFIHASVDTLGILCGVVCTVQVAMLFLVIFLTERKLKKHFPETPLDEESTED